MRRKREAVLPLAWNNDHLPKVVREDREKYKRISRLLDENPEILDRVHEDLEKLSQGGRPGRQADFMSETILGALLVHALQGLSLREMVILIAGSDFLQDFLRTRKKAVMGFTFLDKCLLAIPRRMRDFADAVMSTWQAFRAGIEGTISGLKRAFRLSRCFLGVLRSLHRTVLPQDVVDAGRSDHCILGCAILAGHKGCFYRGFKGFASALVVHPILIDWC